MRHIRLVIQLMDVPQVSLRCIKWIYSTPTNGQCTGSIIISL